MVLNINTVTSYKKFLTVHGNYSEFTNWSLNCYEVNPTTWAKQRTRSCSNPAPFNGGMNCDCNNPAPYNCVGSWKEVSSTDCPRGNKKENSQQLLSISSNFLTFYLSSVEEG
jgi:hypothetical protein